MIMASVRFMMSFNRKPTRKVIFYGFQAKSALNIIDALKKVEN